MSDHVEIHRREFLAAAAAIATGSSAQTAEPDAAGRRLRVGLCAKDITPTEFPVVVNGMFGPRLAQKAHTRLFARAMVLDDGTLRIAIVVLDSCVLPREMLDEVKEQAGKLTGIAADYMMISATHCHTAPSVMGALGCDIDPKYAKFLPGCLVEAIRQAASAMAPARVGWAVAKAPDFNDCRRGIFPPDKIGTDPFGDKTVRVNMHTSGLGAAGPTDPDLSLLALQSPEGKPLAVLANYAMHYFAGDPIVSGDVGGLFGEKFAALTGAERQAPPFVGIFSQGTSGDQYSRAYHKPQPSFNLQTYTEGLARIAVAAYRSIQFRDWAPLAMAETRLTLRRRGPDDQRLAWARQVLDGKIPPPTGLSKVYAREAILLHEKPEAELKLQAIRIGDLGITALPNEVYAVTGLKLKALSPLGPTFNIELANGEEGYIPPPEQHKLGGYTTWPARTAALEPEAEPKIVEAMLGLLEKVSGKPRRSPPEAIGPYARAVLASKPSVYWRLRDFGGPAAADASGNKSAGAYEDGVAFYLEGPDLPGCRTTEEIARAARFIGGRVKAEVDALGDACTAEMWFWNALPTDAREVTGYLFSRSGAGEPAAAEWLAIGGKAAGGKLLLGTTAGQEPLVGKTAIALRTWNHLAWVRQGEKVSAYLNGNSTPEIGGELPLRFPAGPVRVFVGGRSDGAADFEGKIAEVALYGRALGPEEIAEHVAAARS